MRIDFERALQSALTETWIAAGMEPEPGEAERLANELLDRMPQVLFGDYEIPKHANELKELGMEIERKRLKPMVERALADENARGALMEELEPRRGRGPR